MAEGAGEGVKSSWEASPGLCRVKSSWALTPALVGSPQGLARRWGSLQAEDRHCHHAGQPPMA